MAHVHTYGQVAPAAAGIIQYDPLLLLHFDTLIHICASQFGRHFLLCDRVRFWLVWLRVWSLKESDMIAMRI